MQGQAWSMDLVIAVLIFTAVIAIFFAYLSRERPNDVDALEQDARIIASRLDTEKSPAIPLVEKGQIHDPELFELYNASYDELREKFGVKGDFCIYIETEDGTVIEVPVASGTKLSVGNGNVSINGVPCGGTI